MSNSLFEIDAIDVLDAKAEEIDILMKDVHKERALHGEVHHVYNCNGDCAGGCTNFCGGNCEGGCEGSCRGGFF